MLHSNARQKMKPHKKTKINRCVWQTQTGWTAMSWGRGPGGPGGAFAQKTITFARMSEHVGLKWVRVCQCSVDADADGE